MSAKQLPLTAFASVNPRSTHGTLAPNTQVSFIAMQDVSENGEWKTHQTRKYRDVAAGFTRFSENDVLFAKITPCMENGKGCLARGLTSGAGFGSTEFHVLRANSNADAGFVFHWSQSIALRQAAKNFMTGSAGQQRVQTRFFSEFLVAELSRPEQRRIAEILDTLDEAIRKTEQVIAKLQQMKQGLLHDLLTRGIDENGELRDPLRHPEQFKDSPLGRIPKEWDVETVGSTCAILNTLRMPIAGDVREKMPGPYPYYGPTGVLDWLNEYRVEGDYVLLGEDGDHFLKFASWQMTQLVSGRFNVNNHAHILQGLGSCSTVWLHHYFKHRDITLYTTRQGAGRFKLNKANLQQLPLVVPPSDEQAAIARHLDGHEGEIASQGKALSKLRLLKQGLMDDLLTGRVRVKVTESAE